MRSSSSASLAMPFLALTAHPAVGAVLLDSRPAWVWNADGNRILWTNAAGLAFFDETSISALLDRTFGDVHPARRHLARLARNARPNAPLLDRLRFFLGARAITITCLCKRLEVEGEAVVLVLTTDAEEILSDRDESAHRLISAFEQEGDMQAALLNADGNSLADSAAFRSLVADYQALEGLFSGADEAPGLATSTFEAPGKPALLAGLARICHEDETHYLFLTAPDADLSEPDYSALDALDELDHIADNDADVADIFELDGGISYIPFARGDAKQDDIKPFMEDQSSELHDADKPTPGNDDPKGVDSNPFANVTSLRNRQAFLVPATSADFDGARGASNNDDIPDSKDGPDSNIVNLSFGTKPSALSMGDDTDISQIIENVEISGEGDLIDLPPVLGASKKGKKQSEGDKRPAKAGDSASQSGKSKDKKKKKKHKKQEKFAFKSSGGPYHFVWESDEVGRITYLSSDLEQAVGPKFAAIIGKTWVEVATAFEMDKEGKIARAFEARDTWSSLTVRWPVEAHDARIPVEMTGLPVFGRFHGFQGFRGFGICRTHDAVKEPSPPTGFQPMDEADRAKLSSDQDESFDGQGLMGADLLAAADHAVRTAEEMVSSGRSDGARTLKEASGTQTDLSATPEEAETQLPLADLNENGVMTVSDDQNNDTEIDRKSSDQAARHAIEGKNSNAGLPLEGYDLVASMMRQEQERQDKAEQDKAQQDTEQTVEGDTGKDQTYASSAEDLPMLQTSIDDDDFDSANMASLSRGEKDAFDKIAMALNVPIGDQNQGQIEESGKANDATSTQAAGKEASETTVQPAATAPSDHDQALRSAASSAFRDIFAMDPAFRHMRERLAQQDKAQQTAAETASKVGAKQSKKQLEQASLASIAPDHKPATGEEALTTKDEVVASNAVQTADLFAQDRQTPYPLGLEDDEEDKEAGAESKAHIATDHTDDEVEPAAQETEGAESGEGTVPDPDDEEDKGNSPVTTVGLAAAAGLAAVASTQILDGNGNKGTEDQADTDQDQAVAAHKTMADVADPATLAALWNRDNDQSALIDLLNKLPTALIVSAGEQVLYASKVALRILGHASADDLAKAGGMQSLFTGRPGDWLTKTDGRTTLRNAKGHPVSVNATISSINWGQEPAALLSFAEAPNEAPAIGLSEEDEKIAELEAILDTATDGVVVLDADASILRMNHSAEALFEVDRHEVAGSSFLTLLAEESHKDAIDYLDGLVANGVASVLNDGREVIGRVASGGLIPLFMTLGRVAIPGTDRFCAVVRDIAQWKRAEEDLLAEKHRAQDASNQKSDFLAKVSHEIRTPLNAIIGFSEVMMEERFGDVGNERYKDYLKDIHTSGNHIMSLINDLLDLSKVEAGKMDLHFEATELNALVSESVALMQPEANREQIIIRTSLSSKLPEVVGDTRSIKQIILNLLSNGVKYTPAGGQVIISTAYEDNGEVVLRIRDTGIGMNEEETQTALEPFRQVSNVRGAQQGTGLGLPLTKALAEANRARFSIVSAKDHGTLVEITFPNARVLAG